MALTVDLLKAFMHQTLLDAFPDIEEENEDGSKTIKPNKTLESAVLVSNQNYNSLTGNAPSRAVVRFDSTSYQVKVALIYIYEFICQDDALMHSLSLSSMSLSENQVFEQYFALRNEEQKEVDAMRKEFLDEIKDKEEDEKHYGVMLNHRYGLRGSGRRLP